MPLDALQVDDAFVTYITVGKLGYGGWTEHCSSIN